MEVKIDTLPSQFLDPKIVEGYHNWYHKFIEDQKVQFSKLPPEDQAQVDTVGTALSMMIYLGLVMTIQHGNAMFPEQIEAAMQNAYLFFDKTYSQAEMPTPQGTMQ